MKPFAKILAVCLMLSVSSWIIPKKATAQVAVSFQVFYDNLSPYGSWVTYPNYGYVWVPNVGADFTPYGTNGHWVYTDDGWTWVSDYAWGWAPFHYGRWYYDPNYGWIWVPDTVWGPAWVSWRTGGGCYGWTPLAPGFAIGVAFYAPPERWMFCRQEYINSPYINRYYLPREQVTTIYNNTTIINRTYVDNGRRATYAVGPDRTEVERVTHTTIKPAVIRESSRPGQSTAGGGAVSMYRPAVQRTASNGAKPAPAHVADIKTVRPAGRTTAAPASHTTTTATQHKNVPLNTQLKTSQSRSNYPSPYAVHPATKTNTPKSNPQPARQQAQPQQRAQPAAKPQQRAQPAAKPQAQPQQRAQPRVIEPQRVAPQRSAPQQRTAPQRPAPRQSAPQPQRKKGPGQ